MAISDEDLIECWFDRLNEPDMVKAEEVFRELKRTALKSRIELLGRDKALEAGLAERNDPLINLGLACYGTNEEVFTALYKHGLAKPADAADERYKLGLRIGCLSNRSAARSVFDFPRMNHAMTCSRRTTKCTAAAR